MTLIVAAIGRDSIWMVADRRLSYRSRGPKDDARKMTLLEATDGIAILGYAGLGATSAGTEPADWMAAIVRGRNWPLEQALDAIAQAANKELPAHMRRMPGGAPQHHIIIPAFVGAEARLYAIGVAMQADRKSHVLRWERIRASNSADQIVRPPRSAAVGSGAPSLASDRRWTRSVLRLISAHEQGRVSSETVADRLAALNDQVAQATKDGSVGPRSIVTWRYRKGGAIHDGGGGHRCYNGKSHESETPTLPTIANGLDVCALAEVTSRHIFPQMIAAMQNGSPPPEPDADAINAELARMPWGPDEKLR